MEFICFQLYVMRVVDYFNDILLLDVLVIVDWIDTRHQFSLFSTYKAFSYNIFLMFFFFFPECRELPAATLICKFYNLLYWFNRIIKRK